MNEVEFTPQGWQCPVCKRVYSPMTPMCYYCGNNTVTVGTSTGTSITSHDPPSDEIKKWLEQQTTR